MKKHVQKEEEVKKEEVKVDQGSVTASELAKLVDLWQQLKDIGVNSISDLEVKIARLQ